MNVSCPLCNGTGRLINSLARGGSMACLLCDGTGNVAAAVSEQVEMATGIAPPVKRDPVLFDESDWK